MAIFSKQLFQYYEGANLVVVYSDEDKAAQEIHSLAVADLWTVFCVCGQHVVQRILLRFDWGNKRTNLGLSECTFHVKSDLLLHSEVVYCALF